MNSALGIDIGGTKIFHGLVDENGKIIGQVIKENTPNNILDIELKLQQIINSYDTNLVGIATAGAVNKENDCILSSTGNLPEGYSKINFKKLSNYKKIFIENDANASCFAEYKTGVCKGCKNSIVLTFGTGVGGGIIVDGKLLKGKSGAAGEMHFKMSTAKKRKCTCGAWDCFEIYASGRGLMLCYEDITNEKISTYEIIKNANNKMQDAVLALNKWNEYIAMGILGLNNIFDTEIFGLTGSLAEFIDIEFIESYVNKNTVTSKTSVKRCAAGNYAGLTGAALIAFELNN